MFINFFNIFLNKKYFKKYLLLYPERSARRGEPTANVKPSTLWTIVSDQYFW
jgi:hypothetical protein